MNDGNRRREPFSRGLAETPKHPIEEGLGARKMIKDLLIPGLEKKFGAGSFRTGGVFHGHIPRQTPGGWRRPDSGRW
jgi:hypothetical protein